MKNTLITRQLLLACGGAGDGTWTKVAYGI